MNGNWNSPETHPYVDDSITTKYGYTSDDVILLYKDGDYMTSCNGFYSEDHGWLNTKGEKVDVIGWTEMPRETDYPINSFKNEAVPFLERKYKHIFVDFDSTLYLWDNHPGRKSVPDTEWASLRLPRNGDCYDRDFINKPLVDYLILSRAEVHLVTWTDFSFEGEAKFNFINREYPDLLTDWISASSNEDKIRLLKAYEYAGNDRATMLMIDDNFNVVHGCRKEGFDVQEPQFIMGLMYKWETNRLVDKDHKGEEWW